MKQMNKEEFEDILREHRSPDGLHILFFYKNSLNKKDFSELLSDLWVQTEFPNQYPKYIILGLFKQADKKILMDDENLRRYNNLIRYERVYRGVQNCVIEKNKMKVKAFSWTTIKKKAKWFANRWRKDGSGKLYSALIPKQHILMFHNGRNESEVVLNPDKLIDLKEIQND